ncbi:Mu transposase C-terminal domain-containing protein [Phreatobacter sp.]|uniref:Mu transposase C-terminal domain-containing protein n=1 Tax=Phreatobacter sp. TaxID=1966341 RepID=UPI0022C559AD|nr:Mu transposase C-terminal domain-containing protein [Phreatobacter sp.]MCZ8313469.1 Mu transposase C-terminal domain-containing protein [Phreatobacter sp.]
MNQIVTDLGISNDSARTIPALVRLARVLHFLHGEELGNWNRSKDGLQTAIAASEDDASLKAHLGNLKIRQLDLDVPLMSVDDPKKSGDVEVSAKACSARTLLRLVNMYEAGGRNASALCPRFPARGNRRMRVHPIAHAAARKIAALYLDPKKPSKKAVYVLLKDEIRDINEVRLQNGEEALPVPSRTYLSQLIDEFDAYEVTFYREGKEAADKKFASVGAGKMVERIGERVEGDEWKIHAFALLVRHDLWRHLNAEQREKALVARYSLTVFIDVASRVILGIHLSPSPTTEAALRAFSLIGQDKTSLANSFGCAAEWDFACGVEKVVVDNGSQFLSYEFQEAVTGLGTEIQYAIAGIPRLRGTIERWFRRIHVDLIGRLPGKTFSKASERDEYKSKELASLSVEEILRVIFRWIADEYHHTPHEGLGGRTPAQEFQRLADKYGVPAPPSYDQRRLALGRRLTRTLGATGVRVANIDYNSEELGDHFSKHDRCKVEVCLDTDRLDEVSVLIGGRWVTVPQRVPGLASGLSLEQWNEVLAEVRRRYGENIEIHYDQVRKAREDVAAIIHQSRTRAVLLEERPTAKAIRFHEAQMGSGFRVTGDPTLVETMPALSIGKVFKTGALAPKTPVKPPTGHDDTPSDANPAPAPLTTTVRIESEGPDVPAPGSDDVTVSQPSTEEDDGDLNFI